LNYYLILGFNTIIYPNDLNIFHAKEKPKTLQSRHLNKKIQNMKVHLRSNFAAKISKFLCFLFAVATLPMVSVTNAQIVYHDINPDVTSTMSSTVGSASNICAIDFNNDGTAEYNFRWDDWGSDWFMHITYANAQNKIALKGTTTNLYGGRFANPYSLNDNINSTLTWGTSSPEPFIGETTVDQNFLGLGDKYVGVKFTINSNVYYGWILVNFSPVSSSRMITVKSYAYNSAPNASILAGQTIATAIDESGALEFNISPNPATDAIYINTNCLQFSYKIFNQTGQAVIQGENAQQTINIATLEKGIYLLQLIESSGNSGSTFKFFKE
jgi:hypothetical protein